MKNCVVLYNSKYSINLNKPRFLTVDPEQSSRKFISTKNEIYCFNTENKHLDKLFELSEGEGEIVSFEYLSLSDDIIVAMDSGLVKLINIPHKSNEEVTFCEGGIETMSWSPDQEVVVFVTKSKLLVVMSCSYDPISESLLDDMSSFGDGEFITVGWGKKETQFHGSVGKQAAKEKSMFTAPDNIDQLKQDINLSWRADGELFTVSFVGAYGRMFKVYNREGMLQFTSEKLNNLGECIAWRPSGNWIAVPHNLPNKYTIGLFEKNGLRHRELVLPFKQEDEKVVNVSWSNDSEILVVQTEKDGKNNLYFYTICNYHWYLKNFIRFSTKIETLYWDSGIKQNKTLHILMDDGQYFVYRLHFAVQYSRGTDERDQSVVAVIDGKNLLLTDFRNRIVPPPMSSYKYEHSCNIIACGFLLNAPNDNEAHLNKLFVVDADNNISYFEMEFECTAHSKNLKSLQPICSQSFDDKLHQSFNFNWINENTMIFCSSHGENSEVVLSSVPDNNKTIQKYPIDSVVGNIAVIDKNQFFVSYINGETVKFSVEDDTLINLGLHFHEGTFCQKTECVVQPNAVNLIGLNDNNDLFVNGVKISEDVTSFFNSGNYLVFTQLNCIKFYRYSLNKVIDERKIERGAKLVTIVANDSKTVLQLPRGNLEVICPRTLSLEIVAKHLDSLQYFKAFNFLRKQRINLNIIFDHNPSKFVENIDVFLNEIQNENWLNLFISELQNQDFTKTMYSTNYMECQSPLPENYKIEEKIKFVCEKLCEKMQQRQVSLYILPIITTYVKVNNLEKSLEIIWNQKRQETDSDCKDSDKNMSEKALKYLLYLVDVNELYNVALGMYDFGLVLFVATKSQKDPKEYIPFLNQLKEHEENYRKFKIDVHLKRFEKALVHIAKCEQSDKFEEALDFIIEKKLYQNALQIYQSQTDNYKQVCKVFADHLRAQGKLENASIMYERAGDLQQAILSAKHVVDWRRCLTLTNILHNGDKESLKNIALSLATSLEETGKHDEAFYILKNFAENEDKAIQSLINGKSFNRALYEVKMSGNQDLIKLVTTSIENYYTVLLASVEADKDTFLKYKNRLVLVRKLKAESNDTDYVENGIDECDLLSDTTSMHSSRYTKSSKGSGKTFRSSKNRRKHERKLLSLKKGNPFEDVALIDAIHNLILKIINQQTHMHDICLSFIEIGRDDFGRNIQHLFGGLLQHIKDSLDTIWIADMQTNTPQITGSHVDYVQFQNAQHYAVLNPLKRFKPELNIIDWEHEILR